MPGNAFAGVPWRVWTRFDIRDRQRKPIYIYIPLFPVRWQPTKREIKTKIYVTPTTRSYIIPFPPAHVFRTLLIREQTRPLKPVTFTRTERPTDIRRCVSPRTRSCLGDRSLRKRKRMCLSCDDDPSQTGYNVFYITYVYAGNKKPNN